MTGLHFLALTGASLLSLQLGPLLGNADDEVASVKPAHTAVRVNCLGAINAARTEVELPAFTAAAGTNKLPVLDGGASSAPPEQPAELVAKPEVQDKTEQNQAQDSTALPGTNMAPALDTGASSSSPLQQRAEQSAVTPNALDKDAKDQATFLESFCSALERGKPQGLVDANGTYMYAPDVSNAGGGCAAAVGYWRGAVSNFVTLPPAYSETEVLYSDSRNISLVGLFNTSVNSTVDCAVITCKFGTGTSTTSSTSAPSTSATAGSTSPTTNSETTEATTPTTVDQASSSVALQPQERRLSAAQSSVTSLLCLSSPPALFKTQEPFTQEQWDKIRGLENSAQPKVLGVCAVAAAALVYSLA